MILGVLAMAGGVLLFTAIAAGIMFSERHGTDHRDDD